MDSSWMQTPLFPQTPERSPMMLFPSLSSQPLCGPLCSSAEHAAYASAPTLPSLSSQRYRPLESHSFASRNQPSQPSQFINDQIHTYPPYNPYIISQYSSSNATYAEPQPLFPSRPAYMPVTASMQLYQSYTSLAPSLARLPDLRPMPAGGLDDHPSLSSPTKLTPPILLTRQTGNKPQPTHVGGLQGRRGILPSAIGRPPAVHGETGHGQKSSSIPVKDADGKYPCPHCAKTYLHAKHLKRHLLRHTGTRPYTCGLCKDTFSRSDILKRHFQKCSVRRGNPTGENHLAHSRLNKKLNMEAAGRLVRRAVVPTRTRSLPSSQPVGLVNFGLDSLQSSFDFASPVYSDENQPISNRESRSSSVKRPNTSGAGANLGNLSVSSSSSYDTTGFGISGQITPDSVTSSGAATPFLFSHDLRPNQLPSDASFINGVPPMGGNKAGQMLSGSSSSLQQIRESSESDGDNVYLKLLRGNTQDDLTSLQYHAINDSAPQAIKSEQGFARFNLSLS